MKKTYTICNSYPKSSELGVVWRQGRAARAAAVSKSYGPKRPSTPTDVMPTLNLMVKAASEEVHITGVVDDQARFELSGVGMEETEFGNDVPIDITFTGVKVGAPYQFCVEHINADRDIALPVDNESWLEFTAEGIYEEEPVPVKNVRPSQPGKTTPRTPGSTSSTATEEEPQQQVSTCDACGSVCPEDGDLPEPEPEPEPDRRAVRGGRLHVLSSDTTSGGSGVKRSASAHSMSWSAQFGVFRGMTKVPAGHLSIAAQEEFEERLGKPEGLAWLHPLSTWLALPEDGTLRAGAALALMNGDEQLNYMVLGGGDIASIGATKNTTTLLAGVREMSREPGAACPVTEASYIRASYTDGSATFYHPTTGQCAGYISSAGRVLSTENGEQYVAVVRDAAGCIRQVWNTWDGLADVVEDAEGGGYRIAIYPPSQVSLPVEEGGLFGSTGEPVREFGVRADSAAKTLTISEKDNTLPDSYPAMETEWQQVDGAWSTARGTGAERVEVRRVRTIAADGQSYYVLTTQQKGGKVATSVREDYAVNTLLGDLLIKRTEGYGGKHAISTEYEYDESGRQIATHSPYSGDTTTVYDMQGRVIGVSEPWGGQVSGVRMTLTTYREGEAAYSNLPQQRDILFGTNNMLSTWRRMLFEYEESDHVRRVITREQELQLSGSSQESVKSERISVQESWLPDAPNRYAAGREKMRLAQNGVETHFFYAAVAAGAPEAQLGASYSVTSETQVAGTLVPGQSTRQVSYITPEGNTVRQEDYALLPNGEWALTNGETYEYDALNRRIRTTWDNGRSESRALTCQGELLWEVNADGVRTDYAYNSARQLIEITRSAVYDGEVCITPEIITEYEHNAAGQITCTTTRTGPMVTETRTEYDLMGRVVKKVDELGRETLTSYSENGLTTTVTTPTGATLITTTNTDGSVAEQSGTGQRTFIYRYDYINGLRTTIYLGDGTTIFSQKITNAYGQTITTTAPTTLASTYLYTRSEYNTKSQLTQRRQGALAPEVYAYDSMGQIVRQTSLLDANAPDDASKNIIVTYAYSYEKTPEGDVYKVITTRRNNAEGEWLTSVQKILISKLSPTLESKQITIDERGHTFTEWTEYGLGTQRMSYQQLPTSAIVATEEVFDGFTTRSVSSTGIHTTYSRRYTATGQELWSTDGRGNTTTTRTDIAGRTIAVTTAAGETTTTAYDPASNNPAVITDALGHTTCYTYDERNRKISEWGSGVQPTAYAYDDADLLISLTTWRMAQQTISTDPLGLEGGDTTTWEYHPATSLLQRMTYADGSGTEYTYDANNRLIRQKNARGLYTAYTYDALRGFLLSVVQTDPALTANQFYRYDLTGQLIEITDAAGTRSFVYDAYGTRTAEHFAIDDTPYTLHEETDTYGRSIGYRLSKSGEQLCAATTGYAADGRISTAGFTHGGAQQEFTYTYLPGSDLLQNLSMPNGLVLEQEYAPRRNLLTTMSYMRGSSLVVRRSYTYDILGHPTARKTERRGGVMNETFGYNDRSELTEAQRGSDLFSYAYDNIGNRTTAREEDEHMTYATNALNQYTQIDTNGSDFIPEYDADGNQTRVMTSAGIWSVTYNAENRAVKYESADGSSVITCAYDYQGRRFEKKVEQNGATTLHERYIYRGYLQIAAIDLMRSYQPALRYITWDPTQTAATRPLALQQNGTWYTYGWDLTKNITEVFTAAAQLDTDYVYTPFGTARAAGNITQPLQWSSEIYDPELALVYYNYRYYNPIDGRWTRRDPIDNNQRSDLYCYSRNKPISNHDVTGLIEYDDIEVNVEEIQPRNGECDGSINSTIYASAYSKEKSTSKLASFARVYGKMVHTIKYVYDLMGSNIRHEFRHASLGNDYWEKFVDEFKPYESKWYFMKSDCGKNFKQYVEKAVKYYNAMIAIAYSQSDIEDYTRRNLSEIYILDAYGRKRNAENEKNEVESKYLFYKKFVETKCK